MKSTELLLADLDREAVGIRKTLERVREGKYDWPALKVDRLRSLTQNEIRCIYILL
jgi:hypothetical protein